MGVVANAPPPPLDAGTGNSYIKLLEHFLDHDLAFMAYDLQYLWRVPTSKPPVLANQHANP